MKQGRPVPIIDGVLVLEHNRNILLEAYDTWVSVKAEKEIELREARIVRRWKRLVHILMTKAKIRQEFGVK